MVIGGYSEQEPHHSTKAYKYDIAGKEWTTSDAELPEGRIKHTCGRIEGSDNKTYVVVLGGEGEREGNKYDHYTIEIYDIEANEWKTG